MQATVDELDLSPPPTPGGWAPWALALLAHGLLALALAWGLAWQRETTTVASAELWSALPQVAAPRAQEPPPEPPAPPAPVPPARPAPPPPPAAEPARRDADIAVQRQREEQRRRDEARRLAEQRAAQEKAERLAQEKAAQEKARREKAERDKAEREKAQREQAAKAKAAQEKAARERAEREQAQLEAERQRNLERMLGQANATGGAQARGTAERDAGPSASYAGRLVAHIRPNIVFADTVPGNPRAEVEVRTLPDGTILSSRLLKSSGHRAWDDAVLRAIERTARLPRDENGRVPPTLILGFRPNE
ncbi:cell envelope integrity protein TolA [Tepidimonas sp.]|uniref:cell envelope integrity protein TolA n=1 Tax=Tepidimonas sp. TaxID=2002775 RepID=UPI00391CF866